MMEYISDNYDLFEQQVNEQDRLHRLYKRLAVEEEAAEREDKHNEII